MRRREFIAGLGAAGWPLLVRAQQQTKPIIGWLGPVPSVRPLVREFEGFPRGLAEVGFSAGRNVTIEYYYYLRPGGPGRGAVEPFLRGLTEVGFSNREVTIESTDGPNERLSKLVAVVGRRRPAAIIASGVLPALVAKAATPDIPIIFVVSVDPVELGLVASLNRPGGNLTGFNLFGAEIAEKRLELLHKAVPAAETIALLVNSVDSPFNQAEVRHMQSAACILGLRLLVFKIATDADVTPAFATLVEQQAGAIVVGGDVPSVTSRDLILSHAVRFALPTMFIYSDEARAGGLLSYSADLFELARQMGTYAGRILKGEKPADLPVVQPAKFEFVINLKTAKALGLNLPPTLLAIADEVIEPDP